MTAKKPLADGLIRAQALSGEHIGLDIRFAHAKNGRVVFGELRQIYHVGGEVTINVIPAFNGSEESLEYSMSDKSVIDVYEGDEVKRTTIDAVADASALS